MSEQDPMGIYVGECVGKGIYTYNTTWLCDPPFWSKREENYESNFLLGFIDFISKIFDLI